jgi:16S rRNA (cytosine967-C5)-methyltransferase
MTVRTNLLVTKERDALALELDKAGIETRAGRWCDTALVVDTRTNLFALDAFQRGAMEAQDEGSQLLADLVVSLAPARPVIVDYCAGAGGKTLAMAARLGNSGRILAADVDGGKLEELRRRARRARVSNAQAVTIEGGAWPRELDAMRAKADVVFVDAPCSGIGALRRNPEARWRLREADIPGFVARQQEIVAAARHLCAPGGKLVYATCSLLRAENQDVVAGLSTIPYRGPFEQQGFFTVTPNRHGTGGFFAAVVGT